MEFQPVETHVEQPRSSKMMTPLIRFYIQGKVNSAALRPLSTEAIKPAATNLTPFSIMSKSSFNRLKLVF
jgi:hypothetical protein